MRAASPQKIASYLAQNAATAFKAELIKTARRDPSEAVRDALFYFDACSTTQRGGIIQGPTEKILRATIRNLIPQVLEDHTDYGTLLAIEAMKKGMVIEGLEPLVSHFVNRPPEKQTARTRALLQDFVVGVHNEQASKTINNFIAFLGERRTPLPH